MISNSAENQTATFRAPYNFGSGRKCLFQQLPGDGSVKLIFLSKRELFIIRHGCQCSHPKAQ
jgi:hypothetical protein